MTKYKDGEISKFIKEFKIFFEHALVLHSKPEKKLSLWI